MISIYLFCYVQLLQRILSFCHECFYLFHSPRNSPPIIGLTPFPPEHLDRSAIILTGFPFFNEDLREPKFLTVLSFSIEEVTNLMCPILETKQEKGKTNRRTKPTNREQEVQRGLIRSSAKERHI